eukprot:CAMPEP_0181311258 /NCGR_PEP_ID=MMETSP1101-20121128/13037_1 /TAXON_ID=46948 /ORGANISM="Rhodomonas abbreviata, Strain Caron Lab Isolate" /LENGTH=280 /DNA_ID=CAMNT_0023417969 /DNA_START=30 /DNA_END=872 /DNA_ORIENTATION=-
MAEDEVVFDDIPASGSEAAGDSRYTLTSEELGWAAELTAALKAEGVPVPKPDLLFAQFVIIGKGQTAKAVQRVKNYIKNIEEGLGYTTETAKQNGVAGFFDRKWPGSVAAAKDHDGHPMLAVDVTLYRPAELKGDEEYRQLFQEFLLMLDACNADLDDVRNGTMFINQAKGMGWHNFSLELEKRAAVLYQDAYPVRFHSFPIVDAGSIISAILKLCKVFLSKKLAERMIVCSHEDLQTKHGIDPSGLPPFLGGSLESSYDDWLQSKLARRAASVGLVKVP